MVDGYIVCVLLLPFKDLYETAIYTTTMHVDFAVIHADLTLFIKTCVHRQMCITFVQTLF